MGLSHLKVVDFAILQAKYESLRVSTHRFLSAPDLKLGVELTITFGNAAKIISGMSGIQQHPQGQIDYYTNDGVHTLKALTLRSVPKDIKKILKINQSIWNKLNPYIARFYNIYELQLDEKIVKDAELDKSDLSRGIIISFTTLFPHRTYDQVDKEFPLDSSNTNYLITLPSGKKSYYRYTAYQGVSELDKLECAIFPGAEIDPIFGFIASKIAPELLDLLKEVIDTQNHDFTAHTFFKNKDTYQLSDCKARDRAREMLGDIQKAADGNIDLQHSRLFNCPVISSEGRYSDDSAAMFEQLAGLCHREILRDYWKENPEELKYTVECAELFICMLESVKERFDKYVNSDEWKRIPETANAKPATYDDFKHYMLYVYFNRNFFRVIDPREPDYKEKLWDKLPMSELNRDAIYIDAMNDLKDRMGRENVSYADLIYGPFK